MNLTPLFGVGHELTIGEMSCRAVFVFVYTLVLIRLSGRRSFGLKSPLDNIIIVLLGAVLSRAIVGASPFIPTLGAGFVIALMHRFFAFIALWHYFGKWIKGKKVLLFKKGNFISSNLRKCLVSKEDVLEEVRVRALVNSLDEIDEIYMERNGIISTIKKNK